MLPEDKFTQISLSRCKVIRGNIVCFGGLLEVLKKKTHHIFSCWKKRKIETNIVNIITSALRFIWKASTYRTAQKRGRQDVLTANITVKSQFYLRESSFIKTHDWNCVTGANILHPDRCVSLQMPFSCQQSLDGVAPITICLSSS